ncbi:MAG: DUF4091 domain-containing protein [Clostridia bacterium]|nr:DUF4091 domain-containing protein [Clostridia bacterium]
MSKAIKKPLLYLLTVLSAIVFALGVWFGLDTNQSSVTANAASYTRITGTASSESVNGKLTLNSFRTQTGGSVRLVAPKGLRYVTEISPADVAKLPENAVFGTLLMPKDKLGDNELVKGLVVNGAKAMDIKAMSWKDTTIATSSDKYTYTAVLVGSATADLPVSYYNRDIVARGYVTYTDAAGKTYTVYASNSQTRNIAYVANQTLINEGLTDEAETLMNTIIKTAVTSFAVNEDKVTLGVSKNTTYTITTTRTGLNGRSVDGLIPTYVIANTDVATIDQNGTITAKSAGVTTLTATLGNFTDTVEIVVQDTLWNNVDEITRINFTDYYMGANGKTGDGISNISVANLSEANAVGGRTGGSYYFVEQAYRDNASAESWRKATQRFVLKPYYDKTVYEAYANANQNASLSFDVYLTEALADGETPLKENYSYYLNGQTSPLKMSTNKWYTFQIPLSTLLTNWDAIKTPGETNDSTIALFSVAGEFSSATRELNFWIGNFTLSATTDTSTGPVIETVETSAMQLKDLAGMETFDLSSLLTDAQKESLEAIKGDYEVSYSVSYAGQNAEVNGSVMTTAGVDALSTVEIYVGTSMFYSAQMDFYTSFARSWNVISARMNGVDYMCNGQIKNDYGTIEYLENYAGVNDVYKLTTTTEYAQFNGISIMPMHGESYYQEIYDLDSSAKLTFQIYWEDLKGAEYLTPMSTISYDRQSKGNRTENTWHTYEIPLSTILANWELLGVSNGGSDARNTIFGVTNSVTDNYSFYFANMTLETTAIPAPELTAIEKTMQPVDVIGLEEYGYDLNRVLEDTEKEALATAKTYQEVYNYPVTYKLLQNGTEVYSGESVINTTAFKGVYTLEIYVSTALFYTAPIYIYDSSTEPYIWNVISAEKNGAAFTSNGTVNAWYGSVTYHNTYANKENVYAITTTANPDAFNGISIKAMYEKSYYEDILADDENAKVTFYLYWEDLMGVNQITVNKEVAYHRDSVKDNTPNVWHKFEVSLSVLLTNWDKQGVGDDGNGASAALVGFNSSGTVTGNYVIYMADLAIETTAAPDAIAPSVEELSGETTLVNTDETPSLDLSTKISPENLTKLENYSTFNGVKGYFDVTYALAKDGVAVTVNGTTVDCDGLVGVYTLTVSVGGVTAYEATLDFYNAENAPITQIPTITTINGTVAEPVDVIGLNGYGYELTRILTAEQVTDLENATSYNGVPYSYPVSYKVYAGEVEATVTDGFVATETLRGEYTVEIYVGTQLFYTATVTFIDSSDSYVYNTATDVSTVSKTGWGGNITVTAVTAAELPIAYTGEATNFLKIKNLNGNKIAIAPEMDAAYYEELKGKNYLVAFDYLLYTNGCENPAIVFQGVSGQYQTKGDAWVTRGDGSQIGFDSNTEGANNTLYLDNLLDGTTTYVMYTYDTPDGYANWELYVGNFRILNTDGSDLPVGKVEPEIESAIENAETTKIDLIGLANYSYDLSTLLPNEYEDDLATARSFNGREEVFDVTYALKQGENEVELSGSFVPCASVSGDYTLEIYVGGVLFYTAPVNFYDSSVRVWNTINADKTGAAFTSNGTVNAWYGSVTYLETYANKENVYAITMTENANQFNGISIKAMYEKSYYEAILAADPNAKVTFYLYWEDLKGVDQITVNSEIHYNRETLKDKTPNVWQKFEVSLSVLLTNWDYQGVASVSWGGADAALVGFNSSTSTVTGNYVIYMADLAIETTAVDTVEPTITQVLRGETTLVNTDETPNLDLSETILEANKTALESYRAFNGVATYFDVTYALAKGEETVMVNGSSVACDGLVGVYDLTAFVGGEIAYTATIDFYNSEVAPETATPTFDARTAETTKVNVLGLSAYEYDFLSVLTADDKVALSSAREFNGEANVFPVTYQVLQGETVVSSGTKVSFAELAGDYTFEIYVGGVLFYTAPVNFYDSSDPFVWNVISAEKNGVDYMCNGAVKNSWGSIEYLETYANASDVYKVTTTNNYEYFNGISIKAMHDKSYYQEILDKDASAKLTFQVYWEDVKGAQYLTENKSSAYQREYIPEEASTWHTYEIPLSRLLDNWDYMGGTNGDSRSILVAIGEGATENFSFYFANMALETTATPDTVDPTVELVTGAAQSVNMAGNTTFDLTSTISGVNQVKLEAMNVFDKNAYMTVENYFEVTYTLTQGETVYDLGTSASIDSSAYLGDYTFNVYIGGVEAYESTLTLYNTDNGYEWNVISSAKDGVDYMCNGVISNASGTIEYLESYAEVNDVYKLTTTTDYNQFNGIGITPMHDKSYYQELAEMDASAKLTFQIYWEDLKGATYLTPMQTGSWGRQSKGNRTENTWHTYEISLSTILANWDKLGVSQPGSGGAQNTIFGIDNGATENFSFYFANMELVVDVPEYFYEATEEETENVVWNSVNPERITDYTAYYVNQPVSWRGGTSFISVDKLSEENALGGRTEGAYYLVTMDTSNADCYHYFALKPLFDKATYQNNYDLSTATLTFDFCFKNVAATPTSTPTLRKVNPLGGAAINAQADTWYTFEVSLAKLLENWDEFQTPNTNDESDLCSIFKLESTFGSDENKDSDPVNMWFGNFELSGKKDADNTVGKAENNTDATIWTATGEKILQNKTYEVGAEALEINAFRNEYESAQIIMTATSEMTYTIELADLTDRWGNVLSADCFDIYHQLYIEVSRSTDPFNSQGAGFYPDALLPYSAAVLKGINTTANGNQGIWVTVNVPKDQEAGVYTGAFTLTIDGKTATVPVCVTVYDYTLSDEVHSTNTFSFNWAAVAAAEGLFADGVTDYSEVSGSNVPYELQQMYRDFLSEYRISTPALAGYTGSDYTSWAGYAYRPNEIFNYTKENDEFTSTFKLLNKDETGYSNMTDYEFNDNVEKWLVSVTEQLKKDPAYRINIISQSTRVRSAVIESTVAALNKDAATEATALAGIDTIHNVRDGSQGGDVIDELVLRHVIEEMYLYSVENNINLFDRSYMFFSGIDEFESKGTLVGDVTWTEYALYVVSRMNAFFNAEEGEDGNMSAWLRAKYGVAEGTFADEILASITAFKMSITSSKISTAELFDSVGVDAIFVPTLDQYHDAEEYAKWQAYAEAHSGKVMWTYTAIHPDAPYTSYHIEDNLLSARLLNWMMYEKDTVGNLYWSTMLSRYLGGFDNDGTIISGMDYYTVAEKYLNQNGEGFLIYPGECYSVTGPVGSVRLQAIRDGVEDYDLLYALEELYVNQGLESFDDVYEYLAETVYFGTKVKYGSNSYYLDGDATYLDNFVSMRGNLATLLEMASDANVQAYLSEASFDKENKTVTFSIKAADGISVLVNGEKLTAVDGVYTKTLSLTSVDSVSILVGGTYELNFSLAHKAEEANATIEGLTNDFLAGVTVTAHYGTTEDGISAGSAESAASAPTGAVADATYYSMSLEKDSTYNGFTFTLTEELKTLLENYSDDAVLQYDFYIEEAGVDNRGVSGYWLGAPRTGYTTNTWITLEVSMRSVLSASGTVVAGSDENGDPRAMSDIYNNALATLGYEYVQTDMNLYIGNFRVVQA